MGWFSPETPRSKRAREGFDGALCPTGLCAHRLPRMLVQQGLRDPRFQVVYLCLNRVRVLRTRPVSVLIQLLAPCAAFLISFAIIRVRTLRPTSPSQMEIGAGADI